MYQLPYFSSENKDDVLSFMKAHSFVTLCGVANDGFPVATHIPVLFTERDDKIILHGHIQRKSSHHKAFLSNNKVLTIFTGPHTYVSASWYPNPQVASTWNYQAVHASGILEFVDDDALYQMLKTLTLHYEKNADSPALVERMPADYVHKTMKGIVGFEIEITLIQHTFKLSQNKDEQTQKAVFDKLEHLQDFNAHLIAQEMKKRM